MHKSAEKPAWKAPHEKVRLGVSSCLLGQNVRFDGGHKRDPFLTELLGRYFEWVPVCPEMEIGLGAPRESLRLVGGGEGVRLVAPASGLDHTETMRAWAQRRLEQLAALELDGYILKKDSPSCGLMRVRVYPGGEGAPSRHGRGLYADELLTRFPDLPVEEEGRLHDMPLRENFIARVFCHRRWRSLLAGKPRPRDLVAFHARHKLTLMSHSPVAYRELGRIVARAGSASFAELLGEYGAGFLAAVRHRATPSRHVNVLHHLLGFLKPHLDAGDKAEILERIDAYREGLVPLVVPLTLLQHHFRRHPAEWVMEQTYLNPYPEELMLRS